MGKNKTMRIFLAAEYLSSHFDNTYSFPNPLTFSEWMVVASQLLKIAHSHESGLPNSNDDEIRYKNVADAIKNPFEILEFEFKNMRLDESSEWEIE